VTSDHVVFLDLDGTILDSSVGIIAGLREAYAAVGVATPDDSILRSWIGPPVLETLTREMGAQGADVVQAASNAFRTYFDEVGAHQSKPYEGMRAAMETMSSTAALVVVTHKPRPLADLALSQHALAELVQSIHAPPSPSHHVEKEKLFAEAIAATHPQTAVAAGDRAGDVRSALAQGIHSIGVTWGYGSPEELRSAGAIALARTPEDLCAMALPGGGRR
jgi:phosphoglycolate phosphatase